MQNGLMKNFLFLLCLIVSPAPVFGQKSKSADVQVREFKREKKEKSKPTIRKFNRAEIYAIEVQRQIIKTIDSTMSRLSRTANKLPKNSQVRYDLLVKLANLHIDQAAFVAAEENRNYDKKWEAWNVRGRKGREPQLTDRKSRVYWNRLLSVSDRIMKEYPKGAKSDKLLFNKAVALSFLSRQKEAAQEFTKLIQRYPNSAVTGDAYFSLGDYYFDRNDFSNAVSNYKSALKFKRSKRYGWALYKTGWAYFNLSRYKTALSYWKRTVTYSRITRSKSGIRLKDEAMRDMVFAFAELRQVEPAIAYYRANGGTKYVSPLLLLLGSTYSEQGQYKQAIATLKKFQKLVPFSPEGPTAQKEIISLAYVMNNYEMLWAEIERLGKLYGRTSSWARRNSSDRRLILETQELIKEQVFNYAKLVHKESQKNNSRAGYLEALKGYLLFLRLFPKAKEIPEAKFNMADIEYELKRYREAGKLYLEIALLGKERAVVFDLSTKKPRNIHQVSSKDMLSSYSKDFEKELKVLLKRKPDFDKPPRPLSLKARNFIKACEYYKKWYPDDKKNGKNCDIFVAEIYYRNNDRKNSLNYLWLIAAKYSTQKEGPEAVENLIPLYKDDQSGLLVAVDKLLKIPAYQKGKLGNKLRRLKRGAVIDDIKKEKNLLVRANKYFAESRRNPKSADADALMFNAAVDYENAGAISKAINAYSILVSGYPKFKESQTASLKIARLHDVSYDFGPASNAYLDYVKKYPKAEEAAGAYERSCDLLVALGSPQATGVCQGFIARYPGGGKVFIERHIRNLERAKKYQAMTNVIRDIYFKKYKLNVNERIVNLNRIRKAYSSGSQGTTAAREIESLFKRNKKAVAGEALRYVGEIKFAKAGNPLPNYLKIRLKGGTVEALLQSIQGKQAALNSLEGRYRDVLSSQDSYWGVAALAQIGAAYEDFTQQLENPPAIKGAKLEDVKKELAPQVAQLKQKTSQLFNSALSNLNQFSAYNIYSKQALNGKMRLEGKDLSFDEWVEQPDFIGAEIPAVVKDAID